MPARAKTGGRKAAKSIKTFPPDHEILARLGPDRLLSIAEAAGVKVVGRQPGPSGWVSCHAIGRDDGNPSAGLCIGGGSGSEDPKLLGRYRDHGDGAEQSCSFFDLLVRLGQYPHWRAARDALAAEAGLSTSAPGARVKSGGSPAASPTKATATADLAAKLHWQPTSAPPTALYRWCAAKSLDPLAASFAHPAWVLWPKSSRANRHSCLAFRAFSPVDWSRPVGIVLYLVSGLSFPALDRLPERKTHLVGGSRDGLVPIGTPEQLVSAATHTVWLCEGITDAIALAARLPAGEMAVATVCGAKSFPAELAAAVAGKAVRIVRDCDEAGVAGAAVVARRVRSIASETRIVKLPYPIEPKHGRDLRDFFSDGRTYDELRDLADAAAVEPNTPDDSPDAGADVEGGGSGDPESGDESTTHTGETLDTLTHLANCLIETDADGNEHRVPLRMHEIMALVNRHTGGWPRRVDKALFVPKARDSAGAITADGVDWLESAAGVFGWLAAETGQPIHWHRGTALINKDEFTAELQRSAERYAAIEILPHCPPMPGHFYAHRTIEPGKGTYARQLLDRFCPATDADDNLILAFLLTLLWGGQPGSRPAFCITSDAGRGVGKTSLATIVGDLFGGAISFDAAEEIGQIKQRLLSPEASTIRLALLDNAKSLNFSWAELEGLITLPMISGKRMYVGDATRPNTLTWAITLNGASLSTDMAQRCVIIKLRMPDRATAADMSSVAAWHEETIRFVREHRRQIIGDLIAFFAQPVDQDDLQKKLPHYTRWASWERDILARLPDPIGIQRTIAERQGEANVDVELADVIEYEFERQLDALGYATEIDKIHIPTKVASKWYNEAAGERKSVSGSSRILSQMVREGRLKRILIETHKGHGRGYLWIGSEIANESTTRMDLESRISNFRKGT